MAKNLSTLWLLAISALLLISCNPLSTSIFAKKTQRELYEDKLIKDSGKNNPTINKWLDAAEYSLQHPLSIPTPYREWGRFSAANHTATALKVFVKRGQKLLVNLTKTSDNPFAVYMDIWQAGDSVLGTPPRYLQASDTASNQMEYIAAQDEELIVRYQSQISVNGAYSVVIATAPSFGFPIAASAKSNIGSFWGAGRDGGARKHEGIDIFAAAKSPAVAVADGYITSVTENALGGKVVFMRPHKTNYNVYYAHLDSQLVTTGQQVKAGEIIGLVGNTGNARTTAPHLHFGIYSVGGAIDPLAFVKQEQPLPQAKAPAFANTGLVTTKVTKLYADLSMKRVVQILEKNTPMHAEAFDGKHYRVVLPDGRKAFAEAKNLATRKENGAAGAKSKV